MSTPNPLDPDGALDEQLTGVFIAALEWSSARKACLAEIHAKGSVNSEMVSRLANSEAKLQAEVDK